MCAKRRRPGRASNNIIVAQQLVQAGGVVAILAAVFLGPVPPTSIAPTVPSEVAPRYQLTRASLARVRMLSAIGSEPEARGCSAAITSPETARDRIALSVQCGVQGDLTIKIEHLPHAPRGGRTCRWATAIPGVTCQESGSIAEPLRGQLLAALDRVFAHVFPEDPFAPERDWDAPAVLAGGAIALLVIFLWLVVSGAFTFGSLEKGDWIALVPFAGAFVVRELLTLHSVQEIEIQFALTLVGRHSVVYPLFQLFYSRLVQDPQTVTFHLNGVLGALAVLPLYLFVRQRTEDRVAGFVVACFLAVNPLVARFAPTDAPYSFILVTWFSALALLSAPNTDALSTFGGAALLGVAASARMDGLLYLAAAALMLDSKLLFTRIRRTPAAALIGVGAIVLLIGVQMYCLLAYHGPGMHPQNPLGRIQEIWQEAMLQPMSDPLWKGLLIAGAVAGFVRRWRLGLGAFVAVVILQLLTQPSAESPNAWHHLVPIVALQCVVAGIGVTALARLLTGSQTKGWAAALPGIAVAGHVFLAHRGVLNASYVFNDEYAMLRNHFVREGIIETHCDLLVMTRVERDVEIRDFRRVLPGATIVDCAVNDCAHHLTPDRCHDYMRSAACFYHFDGLPRGCAEARSDEDILRECLMPECTTLESAAELTPIEERSIHPRITFPDEGWRYPERIPVALFRAVRR